MDTGGEQSSRLDRLENDIADAKNRLSSLESELAIVKQGSAAMQLQLTGQDEKLDKILRWVDGANKVAGVATRHWRTALKFGLGMATAYGITNPALSRMATFAGKFFGL